MVGGDEVEADGSGDSGGSDADGDRRSGTMADRVAGSRLRAWLLLDGDRHLVAAGILASFFLVVVAVGTAQPTPASVLLDRGDPVETLYQALVTSTVTGVTLVLTIGQLVLSQELGAVGDQRERMEGAVDFRHDVADAVGTAVAPAEPSAFLRGLVAATRRRADAFGESVGADDGTSEDAAPAVADPDADAGADADAEDLATAADAYVAAVRRDADAVADRLDGARFGEFEVVRAALDYDYSWKLYVGRRIREVYADDLPEAAAEDLEALLSLLRLFGPAREHFKTLYFQWELSDLSRSLLYAAVPALAVAVVSLAFFDPGTVSGATLGVDDALWVLAATTTLSLAPFALLLSYVLRIVTVTKRTLSVGPFVLRETGRSADVE
jgi:hypothetical protein